MQTDNQDCQQDIITIYYEGQRRRDSFLCALCEIYCDVIISISMFPYKISHFPSHDVPSSLLFCYLRFWDLLIPYYHQPIININHRAEPCSEGSPGQLAAITIKLRVCGACWDGGEWRVVPMSSVATHCPFLHHLLPPWLLLGGNAEMMSPDCW